MKRRKMLPSLAVMGILKNKETYFPYIGASIFSIFIYFVFSSILQNDIMKTLPKAEYMMILMGIGLALLGIILVPFLFYTNSFLIKRRKKELGLYSILGMEKRHIGIMLFYETVFIYIITVSGGILFGIVFSKLIFLLLLNMTHLPVNISFSFHIQALKYTLLFFAFIDILNLITNLIQVGKANPTELLQSGKKGEKELKHLWIPATLGIIILGWGYKIAVTAKLDDMIFINFFLAVFLVIIGTYFLFTSGSIVLFRWLKKKKSFYYKSKNFVTISGILYRMKKNAAGLVNICIFSTMVIITLICTLSLYTGTPGILEYQFPTDLEFQFDAEIMLNSDKKEAIQKKIDEIKNNYSIEIEQQAEYTYQSIFLKKTGNEFSVIPTDENDYQNYYHVRFLTLKEYNHVMQTEKTLEENEILSFSTGASLGETELKIGEEIFQVKEELLEFVDEKKAEQSQFQQYFLIVKDEEVLQKLINTFINRGSEEKVYKMVFKFNGTEEEKDAFAEEIISYTSKMLENISYSSSNQASNREMTKSMNGGLMFIGIFFGIVFMMCLILILYYKQITEGYEDKDKFEIMQKVGMSDKEVKETIKRQILMIFFMPLLGAVLHSLIAIPMIQNLLGVLFLFNNTLIAICTIIIILIFSGLYILSYIITAKTYYRIVQRL